MDGSAGGGGGGGSGLGKRCSLGCPYCLDYPSNVTSLKRPSGHTRWGSLAAHLQATTHPVPIL